MNLETEYNFPKSVRHPFFLGENVRWTIWWHIEVRIKSLAITNCGKTSLLSTLEDNLIIDLEDGSDYVEALKVKVHSVNELNALCKEIIKAGCPYKFITIDTITALEEIAKPLALSMYKASPVGKNYTGNDILSLPMGAGL